MKLYYFPTSLNSHKVLMALEELGLDWEGQHVNIVTGGNYKPEFVKINPNATVPVLVDGTKVLKDSKDIIEYLCSIRNKEGIHDVDLALEQSWIDKISKFNERTFSYGCMPAGKKKIGLKMTRFKHKVLARRLRENLNMAEIYQAKIKDIESMLGDISDEIAIAKEKKYLEGVFDDAEKQLSKTKFLAGDSFSMADALMAAVLARLEFLDQNAMINSRHNLCEYFQRIKNRDSYKKAIAKNQSLVTNVTIVFPSLLKFFIKDFMNWF